VNKDRVYSGEAMDIRILLAALVTVLLVALSHATSDDDRTIHIVGEFSARQHVIQILPQLRSTTHSAGSPSLIPCGFVNR